MKAPTTSSILKLLLFVLLFGLTNLTCKRGCAVKSQSNYATNGCGDFIVYDNQAVPDTGHGFISISAKANSMSLDGNTSTFDLSQTTLLNAEIESFSNSFVPYCTDVLNLQERINSWTAISGTVEIRIVESSSDCDERYVVSVILKNATFEDANGNQLILAEKSFLNVLVGWYCC